MLCKIYGLSGAAAVFCCLWCEITKYTMQIPKDQRPPHRLRTLQSLKDNNRQFQEDGSKLPQAQKYFNCIHPPLLDIELTHVCIPGLHLSLGIFQRLYNLFEQMNTELDLEIAFSVGTACDESLENLNEQFKYALETVKVYHKTLEEAQQMRDEADQLYDTICRLLTGGVLMEDSYIQMMEEASKKEESARNLVSEAENIKPTEAKQGPCVSQLDATLKELKVERQAYHGGAFIGNHIQKLVEGSSIKKLSNSPLLVAEKVCPNVLGKAQAIQQKFEEALTTFSKCHKTYNKGGPVTDVEINVLEVDIKTFMAKYRQTWPNSTTIPKMHILEDHVCSFLSSTHMGLGFMGEQGAESLHSEFNNMEKGYRNIYDPLERLKNLLREHIRRVHPAVRQATPAVMPRNFCIEE